MAEVSTCSEDDGAHSVVLWVTVEGNIGCGKSTLLKKVKNLLHPLMDVHILDENIKAWEEFNVDGNGTLFKLYNANPHEYAFQFQLNALADRVQSERLAKEEAKVYKGAHVVLSERSRESDMLFAVAHHDMENMTDSEFAIYMKMYTNFQESDPAKVELRYILREDAPQCKLNVTSRSRGGEETLTVPYLDRIETLHGRYDWTCGGKKCAVLAEYGPKYYDVVAYKMSASIVHMVLAKYYAHYRISSNQDLSQQMPTIAEADRAVMQLFRVYLQHLIDRANGAGREAAPFVVKSIDGTDW